MHTDVVTGWNQLRDWVLVERLGRKRYVRTVVFTLLTGFAVIFAPLFLIFLLPDFDSEFLALPIAAIGIAVAIVMILVYSAASVARLRDMGRSRNWLVVGLVPYANVAFFLTLALAEGKFAKARERELEETEPKKRVSKAKLKV